MRPLSLSVSRSASLVSVVSLRRLVLSSCLYFDCLSIVEEEPTTIWLDTLNLRNMWTITQGRKEGSIHAEGREPRSTRAELRWPCVFLRKLPLCYAEHPGNPIQGRKTDELYTSCANSSKIFGPEQNRINQTVNTAPHIGQQGC